MNKLAVILLLAFVSPTFAQSDADGLDLPIAPPDPYAPKAPPPPRRHLVTELPGDEPPRDTPPPQIYGEELNSENDTIFYVIDISSSMNEDPQSFVTLDGTPSYGPRLVRAQAELSRSITSLSPNFKFNIICYDCGMWKWQPQLVEANDQNKQAALGWIQALWVGNSTGTGPATSWALQEPGNMLVVLLTDGAPNCGAAGLEGHRLMIMRNNKNGAVVDVFGIAATGEYRNWCQRVAADSGGRYFDVP